MAYNNREKLVKIGKEAFAMLDEYYCFEKKAAARPINIVAQRPPQQYLCKYQYQPQESHVYVVTQISPPTKESAAASLDCYEAAKVYGGMVIDDYPKRKPITRVPYNY